MHEEQGAMTKFYVQSGNLRLVIAANNSRGAALWAVHRALSATLPFAGEESENPTNGEAHRFKLAEGIAVSQRGFDRDDSRRFATLDIVTEWSQLVSALSRLEQDLLEPALEAAL